MLRRLSGDVSGVVIIYSRKVTNGKTYLTIKCSGSYNGAFMNQGQDNLAMSAVGSNCIFVPDPSQRPTMKNTYSDGHTSYAS